MEAWNPVSPPGGKSLRGSTSAGEAGSELPSQALSPPPPGGPPSAGLAALPPCAQTPRPGPSYESPPAPPRPRPRKGCAHPDTSPGRPARGRWTRERPGMSACPSPLLGPAPWPRLFKDKTVLPMPVALGGLLSVCGGVCGLQTKAVALFRGGRRTRWVRGPGVVHEGLRPVPGRRGAAQRVCAAMWAEWWAVCTGSWE